MDRDDIGQVIATQVGGCLVVTLPAEVMPQVFDEVRARTLEGLRRGGAGHVVFELSAVQVLDLEDFDTLRAIASMALLLGARPMLVGLRAGIVMHLVDVDADTSGLEAARDLEEALARAAGDGGREASPG